MRFISPPLLALALISGAAQAQQGIAGQYDWEQFAKRMTPSPKVEPLGDNPFGETISLSNGALSFAVTDVSLPGNHALPVAFGRTYEVFNRRWYPSDGAMADWQLDAPHIAVVSEADWVVADGSGVSGQRCSLTTGPRRPQRFTVNDFWTGMTVRLSGGGGEMLITATTTAKPANGATYPWMTADQTHFTCLPALRNGTGEGFLAITSDGTRYWFDWMAAYQEPRVEGIFYDGAGAIVRNGMSRRRNVLYATRVEDRFGNRVDYTYTNGALERARLTRIAASDGRTLDITYNGQGEVATVSDGSRQWTYAYGITPQGRRTLTGVTQPDGHAWGLQLAALTDGEILFNENPVGEPLRDCLVNETPINVNAEPVGTLTHPSGLVGRYTVGLREHGRSNVPVNCLNVTTTVGKPPGSDNNTQDDVNLFPTGAWSWTLLRRSLSGPGVPETQWRYAYDTDISQHWYPGTTYEFPVCTGPQCLQPACLSDACAGSSRTVVTRPDGSWERHVYGNSFQYNEGKLLAIEVGQGASVLETTRSTWDLAPTGVTYPASYGTSTRGWDGVMASKNQPLLSRTIDRDGVRFERTHTAFDTLSRPTASVERSTDLGSGAVRHSRTVTTQYRDDPAAWVLGQVERLAVNGIEAERVTFDGRSLPQQVFVFGALRHTLGYHPDGALHTVTNGRNHTLGLSDWYRGVPRRIDYPDGTAMTATVSPQGWVTSATDQNGFTTSYSHDAMGRLSRIDYPQGDAVSPVPTIMTLTRIDTLQHGSTGHWRRSTYRGPQHTNLYLDALFRPIMEERLDVNDIPNTVTQVVKQYDALGRLVFESYPQGGIAAGFAGAYTGVRTQYDALGRVTQVTQDSELGPLTTTTQYLPGFQTRVTNPRGFVTTTSYAAYAEPTTDWPVLISEPEGRTTAIDRDVFGKPLAITRSGALGESQTRRYVYDPQQRLCKQIEPESGASVFGYDAVGNLAWSASGQFLPSATDCNRAAVPLSERIQRTFDAMNRVTLEDRPGAEADITTQYTPDGKVSRLSSGDYHWIYDYNRLRLPTRERMEHIFQGLVYPYQIDWRYDALGHRSGMNVVGMVDVDYAPNALGQPTRVGNYAVGAQYHPNGGLKRVSLGNTLERTFTQNTRGFVERVRDAGWQVVMDETLRYDANGNPVDVLDHLAALPGARRDMRYDGLDRLVMSHVHGLHIENYAYDALDNITRRDFFNGSTTRTDTYTYDSWNRLQSISSPSGTQFFGHDARGNLSQRLNLTHTFGSTNQLLSISNGYRFEYDGYGRRTITWWPGGGGKMDVYDAGGVLRYTSDMRVQGGTVYLHLGGMLIAEHFRRWDGGAEEVKYVHTDTLGSPVVRTDRWAHVQERERFMAFGQPVDGSVREAIGFTGHLEDPALGLTYMQQRYYDPAIGRFLSVDPVGPLSDPINHFGRYHYANNNPYKHIDPDGRCATETGSRICKGVRDAVAREVTRRVVSVVRDTAEQVGNAVESKVQEARALVGTSDKVIEVGVSGQFASALKGNSVTSPSAGGAGGVSILINPSSGQVGVQVSWGATTGFGGGATVGLEASVGLNDGPLMTGRSSAVGSYLTGTEGPLTGSVMAKSSLGQPGGELSAGLRPSIGPYVGAGVVYEESFTAATPELW